MRVFRLLVALSLLATLLPTPLRAEPAAPKKPRIALVLSGGGARGVTHVGVLKVLEELRIPVNFVVGTSMGSAVAGLYASGLTASQLEEVFRKFNWTEAFSDTPSRRERSFRRKEDDRDFPVRASLGVGRDGFKFPRGLVEGQNFVTELRKLSHITASLESFDELPIPFRAIATNLVSGKTVVMDRGDLVQAVRASVAIPPLFTPVERDGQLLVDGGYLKNIPVDVAIAAGAERIIVVNIGTPLNKKENIKTVFDVISQSGRLGGQTQDNIQIEKMRNRDLLITPDLGDLSFTDFDKVSEFIQHGEAAARALTDQLKTFSVSEQEYKRWRASLKPQPSFPEIHQVEIRNDTKIPDAIIRTFIRQPVGQPLDPEMIQQDLSRVYGMGYFEWLDYSIKSREGKEVLVVHAVPKSWGPNYMKLGLKVNENFDGHSSYGILARYQMTELNKWGAEMQVDGEIGTNSGIEAEYYQPVGSIPSKLSYGLPFFVFTSASYARQNEGLLISQDNFVPFQIDNGTGKVGVGRTMGRWGRLKLGMGWTHEELETPTFTSVNAEQTIGDTFGQLEIDTLDNPGFPRKGMVGNLLARWASTSLGADQSDATFSGSIGGARSFGNHTVRLKAITATNLQDSTNDLYYYRLGGWLNLSGYPSNSLFGYDKALGQGQYLYKVGALFKVPLYVGIVGEWGNVWGTLSDMTFDSAIASGSVYTALDTGIGPIYFAYSRVEEGRDAVSFSIGQTF